MLTASDGGRLEGEHAHLLILDCVEPVYQDRFTREIKSTILPKRRDGPGQINPEYQAKLVQLHGAVLGMTAL